MDFGFIKEITKFFKAIGDLFAGIGEFLIKTLMGFENTKNPLFQMPGIKIPVCYLHPFFVIAYLVLQPLKDFLINTVMMAAEPLKYVNLIISLGFSREKWMNWFRSSSQQKNTKLQTMSNNVKDEVDKNITKILWVCFFMLAFSFIFVPLIAAYTYQNTGVALRVMLQIMITTFIVGIIFSNLTFIQTLPITMGIITIVVYSYVRYLRIIAVCAGNKSGSGTVVNETQPTGRLLPFLFMLQEPIDKTSTKFTNFLGNFGKEGFLSKYIYWIAYPIRIIGILTSGSWFSSSERDLNPPDRLYGFLWWFLNKIDIRTQLFGKSKDFKLFDLEKLKEDFINKIPELNSEDLPAPFSSAAVFGELAFKGLHEKAHKKGNDDEKQVGGGEVNNAKIKREIMKMALKMKLRKNWIAALPCRLRKMMIFFSSLYYGSIILIRLVIIPTLIIRYITSLNIEDLLNNTDRTGRLKGFYVLFLTTVLIINVLSTLIIVFPNPNVNHAAMKPFYLISRYMTMVFFPSFIIAYFFNHIVEGCFESYSAIDKIKKAMDDLTGQSKKSKMSAEQEEARNELQTWLECFYEHNNEKRAAKPGKIKKEATQKYKKAEQYKKNLIKEYGLDTWECPPDDGDQSSNESSETGNFGGIV
tara:strand:- start:251 stop:2170 length:1920 start_codon:yes stop_codon:yes gene_type:complete